MLQDPEDASHITVSKVEVGTDPLSSLLGAEPLDDEASTNDNHGPGTGHPTKIDVAKLVESSPLLHKNRIGDSSSTSTATTSNNIFSGDITADDDFLGLDIKSIATKAASDERTEELSRDLGVQLSSSPSAFKPNNSFLALIESSKKGGGNARPNSASSGQGGGGFATNNAQKDEEEDEEDEYASYETRPKPSVTEIKDDFMALFGPKSPEDKDPMVDLEMLTSKAIHCHLAGICVRGICWRVFLVALLDKNIKAWPAEARASRQEYEAMKQKWLVDPHTSDALDPTIHNPLSESEQSPWQQFFQDAELKKQINLDLRRVYPELTFFKQQFIQDEMLRILFIYAREHPRTMYKQGMHELLAPILYVLHREAISEEAKSQITCEEHEREAVAVLCDISSERYVEHDAFSIFSMLMESAASWYVSAERPQPVEKKEAEPFSKETSSIPDTSANSPVVQKCKRIQQELLRRADPQLCQHLNDIKIEPQLYALRWIRLLLGREFHLDDLLILWDAIFAYGRDLVLVDYISVAMLVFIRESLIGRDFTACMQRLFKYPPVEDPTLFIHRALELTNPRARSKSQTQQSVSADPLTPPALTDDTGVEVVAAAAAAPSEAKYTHVTGDNLGDPLGVTSPPPEPKRRASTTSTSSSSTSSGSAGHKAASAITSTLKQLIAVPEPRSRVSSKEAAQREKEELTSKVKAAEQTQLHMSTRLDRIIYSLQNDVLDKKESMSEAERQDAILLAVAELKQVRDILAGTLAIEAPKEEKQGGRSSGKNKKNKKKEGKSSSSSKSSSEGTGL